MRELCGSRPVLGLRTHGETLSTRKKTAGERPEGPDGFCPTGYNGDYDRPRGVAPPYSHVLCERRATLTWSVDPGSRSNRVAVLDVR